jgi:hypothetical protein
LNACGDYAELSRKLIMTPGGVGDARGMFEPNSSVTLVKSRNSQNDDAAYPCEDESVPVILLPMCKFEHMCNFLDIRSHVCATNNATIA